INLGACSGARLGCSSPVSRPPSRPSRPTRSRARTMPAAWSSGPLRSLLLRGWPRFRRAPSAAAGAEPLRSPPGNAVFSRSMTTRADETQQIWLDYRRTGDQKIRDRLILTYAPLVKYVAGRLGSGLPAHVDEGDLVSYGLLGLIGAIERYDPARDVKFETYAMARIKGQIIDELRSMDWVPRSVRARARNIERAIGELEGRLGRAPTDEEIAKKLGITEEELEESLGEIGRSSIAALDELWTVSGSGGDAVALIDTIEDESAPDPQGTLSVTEQKEALADAIARLPEREKL